MSELVKLNTSDLTGPALRWAVAQVEGIPVELAGPCYGTDWRVFMPGRGFAYRPDIDWDQGGPLIGKHQVTITYDSAPDRTPLATTSDRHPSFQAGETILIAACRAIVAAKLGDTIKVPEELAS